MNFDDRDDAIIWIINNQFGRRNLPAYERQQATLELKQALTERPVSIIITASSIFFCVF